MRIGFAKNSSLDLDLFKYFGRIILAGTDYPSEPLNLLVRILEEDWYLASLPKDRGSNDE